MSRHGLITLIILLVLGALLIWTFKIIKKSVKTRKEISVAYSEALVLVKKQEVQKIEIRSSTKGKTVVVQLKDGKKFSCFTTDINLYDRLLINPNIRIEEIWFEETIKFKDVIGFVVLYIIFGIAFYFATKEFFKRKPNIFSRYW